MQEKIAVVGLGYVGLPLALALAKNFPGTVGFDIRPDRIEALKSGDDRTGDVAPDELKASSLKLSSNPGEMRGCSFFIVGVPTPVDENLIPDLSALVSASETVGSVLSPGAVIVYESTVYPGVTEDVCGPALARSSGLRHGTDFKLGYSPERINPGDTEHSLERVVKVISGEDAETLDRICNVYEQIIPAGLFRAPTIKVAEAAKVLENTQRDVNIALINELAIIFERMGISTRDVLAAAATKWNFLNFSPGLVGGHCIGVDPYYLTTRAQALGYYPQVILAGRRVNNGMSQFIADKAVKLLIQREKAGKSARVGVLGLTFKENVSDIRNSRVPDIIFELEKYGIKPLLHDPMASAEEASLHYEVELSPWEAMHDLDLMLLAVPHNFYRQLGQDKLTQLLKRDSILMDVKSMLEPAALPAGILYWSL